MKKEIVKSIILFIIFINAVSIIYACRHYIFQGALKIVTYQLEKELEEDIRQYDYND